MMLHLVWIAIKVGVPLALYGWLFTRLIRNPEREWVRRRLVPVAPVLFVVGMIAPSIWIYWLCITGVIVYLSRTTAEAACLYVVAVLASPSVSREIGVGGVYIMPFDKWLFAALGVFIVSVRHGSRRKLPKGWNDWPFLLALILELAQARGANFTSAVRTVLGVSSALIFPYFTVSRSLRRPEDIRRLLLTIAFAGFILGLEAMYESRTDFLPYEALNVHLGSASLISAYSKQRSGMLRASATFPESTTFGLFLALSFVTMMSSRDVFRSRRMWWVGLGAVLLGLYASNARGPVVGLVLGLLAMDVYRKRFGGLAKKVALIATLGVLAVGYAQVSPSFSERIGLSGGSADSSSYRHQLVTRGIQQIRQHPLLGVSPDRAYTELADLRQGEGIVDFVNAYIYYGMTVGVGGILAMLACFFGSAGHMLAIRKRLQRIDGMIPIAAAIFSVSLFTVFTASTTGFGGKGTSIFYLLLGMGSALGTLRPPAPAVVPPPPDTPTG